MLKKTVFFIILAALAGNSFAQDIQYVRKQLKPDFFIPESALPQQEKLPMPRYYQGQKDTIKVAKPEPARKTVRTDIPSQEGQQSDYQHKYEEYSRDLELINADGTLPKNETLEADLQKMSSDKRIVVEKKPYKIRDSKAKFNKALYDSLNSD